MERKTEVLLTRRKNENVIIRGGLATERLKE